MPGRSYDAGTSYRYGFNGKEKDKDMNSLTAYDYGFRIYNPGIGKFLSTDPLTNKYPELTPYQFASDRPIDGVDLDGLEYVKFNSSMYRMGQYNSLDPFIQVDQKGKLQTINRQVTHYTLNIVYNNIPSSLQDPKTKSYSHLNGGPVTTMGRDYTPQELSKMVIDDSKYFYGGARFYGTADGAAENPPVGASQITPSIQGGGNSGGISAIGSAAGKNGITGIVLNQVHAWGEWSDLADESNMRAAFYNATNIVNAYVNDPGWKKIFDDNNIKAANLINFVTDGSLDLSGIAACSGAENSQDRKNIYQNALYTAWEGLLIIQNLSKAGQNISVQKKTQKNIDEVLAKYKAEGGGNEFDNINQLYK